MAETTIDNGVIIEYMDETTNSRYVEKHTTARTTGEFRQKENIPSTSTISVRFADSNTNVLEDADGSTPINEGDTVTVVSGNKTGGARTAKRSSTKTSTRKLSNKHLVNGKIREITFGDKQSKRTVSTRYRGSLITYELLKGVALPEKNMVSRTNCKYPFHIMEVGECVTVPMQDSASIKNSVRHFQDRHVGKKFMSRSIFLNNDVNTPVIAVWRIK